MRRCLTGDASAGGRKTLPYILLEHGVVTAVFAFLTWIVMFGRSNLFTRQSYAGGLEHDAGTYVWYLFHLKEALFGDGELFFSDRLFFPVGMNMVRQDWTPATAALGLPFAGFGSIGAYNMEVALAFVLCGLFTYMLARHLKARRAYALLAGVIFAYCEFRILKASYHGHLTHVNQQFIPLYLLFALRYFDRQKILDAVGAGVAFFLATFCTPYQMVFLIVWSVFLVLHRFFADLLVGAWPPRVRGPGAMGAALRKTLGFSLLAGGTAVLLVMPLIIAVGPRSLFLMPGALSRFQSIYSADLLSYVIPTLGKDPGWPFFSGEGGCAFQGYTVLALGAFALFAAIRWRAGSGYWLGFGLLFFLLSLGSMLVVGGSEVTWLPFYAVLEQIPILRHARVASRFSSLLTLCLAMAAAVALTRAEGKWLSAWPLKRVRIGRLVVLLLVGIELLGYRAQATLLRDPTIRPFPVPEPYLELAAQEQDSSLLTYPLIWEVASGHLGPLHYPRDYYFFQTIHNKRLITGFGDAVPNTALAYFGRLPLLAELVRIEAGEKLPPPTKEQQAEARAVARGLGIRTILVNMKKLVRDQKDAAVRADRALAYIREVLPTKVIQRDKEAVWLRVTDEAFATDTPGLISFGGAGSLAHLGSGFRRVREGQAWYAEALLGGRETEVLYLPMEGGRGKELVLHLKCAHHEVQLTATLNGKEVGAVTCKPTLSTAKIAIPPSARRPGMNHLRFLTGEDGERRAVPIGKTGVKTRARLSVRSQGLRAGNSASILLGERDLAPDTRGFNVAVIHPGKGDLVMAAGFDLIGEDGPEQAGRMAQLLRGVPEGMIVCVAVKDDGAMNHTGELVTALRTVGASVDLRNRTRASYALIGVKGAAPGQAMERVDPARTATIDLGSLIHIEKVEIK